MTHQQGGRLDLDSAFDGVEHRYLSLLEERRRDLRRIELFEEQALRQRETMERLERERAELEAQLARATDDLRQAADHLGAIQEALGRAEREQQATHSQVEALVRRAERDGQALGEREARVRELERALDTAHAEARDARAELYERDHEFEEARRVSRSLAEALQAGRERIGEAERARQAAETTLAERSRERDDLERRLQEAERARPDPIDFGLVGRATANAAGRIVRATDQFAGACGFESAAALLAADTDLQLPFVFDRAQLARRLDGPGAPVRYEACLRHPDGRFQWVVAAALPHPQSGLSGGAVEWIACDVTGTSLARHQQRLVHRLTTACGLASDVGAVLLREEEGDAARAHSVALRQVVTFARLQARVAELTDVCEVLAATAPSLRWLLGAAIEADIQPVAGPLPTGLDRDAVESILVDAAIAMREALPLGGAVAVRACAAAADAVDAEAPTLIPVARLTLSAEGHGVRDVRLPASLAERAAAAGGHARAERCPHAGVRVEVALPLVVVLRSGQ